MKINKELMKGSSVILILNLLNRRNMYGYEMIKEMELKSESVFVFKEGTIYPILHNLENENYIQSYWETEEGNRKRKYYMITDNGKKLLQEKETEWSLFSRTMNKVLNENSFCKIKV